MCQTRAQFHDNLGALGLSNGQVCTLTLETGRSVWHEEHGGRNSGGADGLGVPGLFVGIDDPLDQWVADDIGSGKELELNARDVA